MFRSYLHPKKENKEKGKEKQKQKQKTKKKRKKKAKQKETERKEKDVSFSVDKEHFVSEYCHFLWLFTIYRGKPVGLRFVQIVSKTSRIGSTICAIHSSLQRVCLYLL